jgi:antibiotic biosynthesis monooxygenase (ABM) superfamily enzyme
MDLFLPLLWIAIQYIVILTAFVVPLTILTLRWLDRRAGKKWGS